MSSNPSKVEPRLGYLLLRDGHAVPLRGISPEEIKAGAKCYVPHPAVDELRHRRLLSAIVDRLGFPGDFGTFLAKGWPDFQDFLRKNRCTHRVGLFPVDYGGCIDLFFTATHGPQPQQLAERLFEAPIPAPRRVFLGYGVDWPAWDGGNGHSVPLAAIATLTGDVENARQRATDLFDRRFELVGDWGFLDNRLVDGPVGELVDKIYWPPGSDLKERQEHTAKSSAAVRAFRAVFDGQPEGWVDVLRFNDRLVVLRGHDGGWDVLWRNYRKSAPPQAEDNKVYNDLAIDDMPSSMLTANTLRRGIYFRQGVWDEREDHEAEQAFYDRGGSMLDRRLTSNANVRESWLREQGQLPAPQRPCWEGALPPGFRIATLDGRRVAMSDLVDVGSFRRMLVETGYSERRVAGNEPWERANEGAAEEAPVGASWLDAQAYCAWKERQLGVALRLPTRKELRILRAAYSRYYDDLRRGDFPWEHASPRPLVGSDNQQTGSQVPTAVLWSEPRFSEQEEDVAKFPRNPSMKRWIQDFPPRAAWVPKLPWAEHGGITFIDAWDAYEWCQERGWVSGRFWEGPLGYDSWGAYKNAKVTFRVVLELGE